MEATGPNGRGGTKVQVAIHADAGPRDRFAALLERHRGIVFKVAGTYCRDAADREDLAQEIAVQLWRAFPQYDDARSFSTWMYRIALNVAISFRRRDARRGNDESLDETSHEIADASTPESGTDDALHVLERFMAELDPLNRALLLLYLDEKSQREIADILGISETNVSTKINRLKQRLRERSAGAAN